MTTLPDDLIACPKCGGETQPGFERGLIVIRCKSCDYARVIKPDDTQARETSGDGCGLLLILCGLVLVVSAVGFAATYFIPVGW